MFLILFCCCASYAEGKKMARCSHFTYYCKKTTALAEITRHKRNICGIWYDRFMYKREKIFLDVAFLDRRAPVGLFSMFIGWYSRDSMI